MEFATGRPDSRPDMGSDWLRGLTNEQLAIVQGWVEANGGSGGAELGAGPREAVALMNAELDALMGCWRDRSASG
jgi:hypothetical protein